MQSEAEMQKNDLVIALIPQPIDRISNKSKSGAHNPILPSIVQFI